MKEVILMLFKAEYFEMKQIRLAQFTVDGLSEGLQ